jgi:hypothetical protein
MAIFRPVRLLTYAVAVDRSWRSTVDLRRQGERWIDALSLAGCRSKALTRLQWIATTQGETP